MPEFQVVQCFAGGEVFDCDADGQRLTRETVIVNARRAYSAQKDQAIIANSRTKFASLCSKVAFVSQALADAGFAVLTPSEEKAVEFRAADGTE